MSNPRRFRAEAGTEIFTGNELLLKGALETPGGVHLLTGHPGSPITGFFNALQTASSLLTEKGMVARIAGNEPLAIAAVNGVQMAGCRGVAVLRASGVQAASHALGMSVARGTGQGAGGLIVCGDDPWNDATQGDIDSRYLAQHLRLPMLEPSCPQEVKDWVAKAFELGKAGEVYIGYLMTVALADGGGTVQCGPNHYPAINAQQKTSLSYAADHQPPDGRVVPLPPGAWKREQGLRARLDAVILEARRLGLNRVMNRPQKGEVVPLGFIASGVASAYLNQALAELGLTGRVPILKLGLSYPLDGDLVADFARQCRQLVVVEERRGFVESQVTRALQPLIQAGRVGTEIYGKKFPGKLRGLPETRGLNPSILIERLGPLLKAHPALPIELTGDRLENELQLIRRTAEHPAITAERTPTFCAGCPIRDASGVMLELRNDLINPAYMHEHHKRKPVDLVVHGDSGCHSLLAYEPYTPLMQSHSGVGLGGATGCGVDRLIENKQAVFMGDGGFFHTGQTAVSQSIRERQDITYIILENGASAMAGHHAHPGAAHTLTGDPAPALQIERVIHGMAPRKPGGAVRVVRVNPADRDRYRRVLERAVLADGVKVVIADKECGVTQQRKERGRERATLAQRGYLPVKTFMHIDQDVCENCLECTKRTACPGLTSIDTDHGPKVQTDLSVCVNDGACQRIDACPAFEEVTVTRAEPARSIDASLDLSDLPRPRSPLHAGQLTWRCHLAGVGGMGVGTGTSVLIAAGHQMGYRVQFLYKRGFAVRHGGVFSQVLFTRMMPAPPGTESTTAQAQSGGNTELATAPVIPYGKADLILGLDPLETARGLDPRYPYRVASPDRTAAVVNTAGDATTAERMGHAIDNPADLEQSLRRHTYAERNFSDNLSELCEQNLGSKKYVNTVMIGVAYQMGLLPLTLEAIEGAIRLKTPGETAENLRALGIGRKLVAQPDAFVDEPRDRSESVRDVVRDKLDDLKSLLGQGRRSTRLIKRFRVLLKQAHRVTRDHPVDDRLMRDVVIRAYDCLVWGGLDYAKRYCDAVAHAYKADRADRGYELTRAVAWNLARVMLIKDEAYVAALLTDPHKYKRDSKRYGVSATSGDRITYRHHHQIAIGLFGRGLRFHVKSRDWQLRLVRRMRFLRWLLPGRYKRERLFRDWYASHVERLDGDLVADAREYQRWLTVLSVPELVTGYREIRGPKMEAARRLVEEVLARDAESFKDTIVDGASLSPSIHILHLPVLSAAEV